MNKLMLFICLALFSFSAAASCTDLKARLDKQLKAKGVKSYSLDIVLTKDVDAALAASAKAAKESGSPTAQPGKVVGTCEAGTKRIIYRRQ